MPYGTLDAVGPCSFHFSFAYRIFDSFHFSFAYRIFDKVMPYAELDDVYQSLIQWSDCSSEWQPFFSPELAIFLFMVVVKFLPSLS